MTTSSHNSRRKQAAATGAAAGVFVSAVVGYIAWHQAEVKDFESRRQDCVDRLIDLDASVGTLGTEFTANPWGPPSETVEPRVVAATGKVRTSLNRVIATCIDPDLLPEKGRRLFEGTMQHSVLLDALRLMPQAVSLPEGFASCQEWSINTANDIKALDGPSLLWWTDRNRPADFAPDGVSDPPTR